jgi:PAS domain S-box-containing protein
LTHADGPYEQLFELSPFPAVVSRLDDSRVLAINARTAELVGVPRDQAIGVRITDYYVDPSQRQVLIDRLRAAGRADDVRVQLRWPDGRIFWSQASARLVTYQGEAAVLTVFNDITDQVAAEQALMASERRLAGQSEALTDLTAQYANLTTRFDERLRTILKTSARTLQAERLACGFDAERTGPLRRPVSLQRTTARVGRDPPARTSPPPTSTPSSASG